jgi:hypothetical protein
MASHGVDVNGVPSAGRVLFQASAMNVVESTASAE